MMNLPDTTTEQGQREASVMLARLCRWDVSYGLIDSDQSWDGFCHDTLTITTDTGEWCDNLYDPANMALAWRVLNWAMSEDMQFVGFVNYGNGWEHKPAEASSHGFSELVEREVDFSLSPADAQRAWLDKILTLAIEAGMLEDTP